MRTKTKTTSTARKSASTPATSCTTAKPAKASQAKAALANPELQRPLPPASIDPKFMFSVEADLERFDRWARTAVGKGLTVRQWVEATLDLAAATA